MESQSQTEAVPLPLTPAQEGPKSHPVKKKETPNWMKDRVSVLKKT